MLHKAGKGDVRVIEDANDGVNDFRKVMRGDIGSHTDGDAAGAIDEKIREAGGEDPWFFKAFIEVRVPIHGLLIDIPEHFGTHFRHPGFSVTVRGGGVAVHVSEVAVAVHEGVAHGEVLRQPDHSVIYGRVAVGVVLAKDFTHAGGGFFKRFIGGKAGFIHRVEDTPVDGFKAVTHVRECAAFDNAHGVFEVAALHFRDQTGLSNDLVRERDILRFVISVMSQFSPLPNYYICTYQDIFHSWFL